MLPKVVQSIYDCQLKLEYLEIMNKEWTNQQKTYVGVALWIYKKPTILIHIHFPTFTNIVVCLIQLDAVVSSCDVIPNCAIEKFAILCMSYILSRIAEGVH